MTRDNMINYVANNIKDYLPAEYRDAEVEVLSVTKLNRSYTGLSVRRPDESVVPTINLDSLLQDIADEADLKTVMRSIGKELVENEKPEFDVDFIHDYSLVKENLFIKLVSRDTNAETLEQIPHVVVEDMAITFHMMIKKDQEQVASATIKNDMLSLWGVDQETLYADAVANSTKILPVKICSLAEQLGLMGMMVPDETPLTIVTNTQGVCGAAVLFYPGVMDILAKRFEGSFYILPSSIHELLALPETEFDGTAETLLEMVTDVNATQVSSEEKLTDAVYYYDADKKAFRKIA